MERFFLGGNSGKGFYSLYEKALADADGVVILKGGAGTGKSTFMKEISARAIALGYEVENWYCSGDPTSLDGVYIKDINKVVVDGTAPHMLDPTIPKIKDEIVNLADCIDRDEIKGCGDEVKKLLNDKKRSYSCAYDHLNIALCYQRQLERMSEEKLDKRKIRGLAREIAYDLNAKGKRCGNGEKYPQRTRFSSAITPDGEVNLYDYLTEKNTYLIKGGESAKQTFFEEVVNVAVADGIMLNPLVPDRIKGVEIGGVALTDDVGKAGRITENVDLAFAESGADKYTMKRTADLRNEQIKIACDYLSTARGFHLEIEKFYVAAMDFEKLGEIKRNSSDLIFEKK